MRLWEGAVQLVRLCNQLLVRCYQDPARLAGVDHAQEFGSGTRVLAE